MGRSAAGPALLIGLLLSLALLAGCQGAGTGQGPRADTPQLPDRSAEVNRLLALGEYGQALPRLREALEQDRENPSLRYGLGVTYSHLGQTREAAEEFNWILRRGNPTTPEFQAARQWLLNAGLLREPLIVWNSSAPTPEPGPTPPVFDPGLAGVVQGRVLMGEADDRRPQPLRPLLLEGSGPGTEGRRFWAKTSRDGSFRFENVPAGPYRLQSKIAGVLLWDQPVSVEAGKARQVEIALPNPAKK